MERGGPLVSIIIPAYNAGTFLSEAVQSAVGQGYRPLEVIIVDDGSTDRTAQVATGLGEPVRYVHQTNAGPAAARNRGLGMARGDVIAFLDADDLWADGALEVQIACLAANAQADIAQGLTQLFRLTEPEGARRFQPFGEPWHLMSLGAAAVRRAVFDKVGLFDEGMRSAEDLDWFLRAKEAGVALVRHQRVVLQYRLHGENVTRQKAWRDAHLAAAFKKSLDRRRRKGGDSALLSPCFSGDEEARGVP